LVAGISTGRPAIPITSTAAAQSSPRTTPTARIRFADRDVSIRYLPFHSTPESLRETQPFVSASGSVFTWDGRLDNRAELLGQVGSGFPENAPDVDLVEALFRRAGIDSLAKLVGDWALSVWNPHDHSLLLARDFLGIRHLYYSAQKHRVTWCTVLDPLVLSLERSLQIDEEYIAGWLSSFPAAHRTPFVGLSAVPPSCYVLFRNGTVSTQRFWNFDPRKSVQYATDEQYEEHFRSLFEESARHRLHSDHPVLAELSGGMDSSSIVCVADKLLAEGRAATLRLDTISYYDDSEPNWNERPYFRKIEEHRGRTGFHIDVAAVPRAAFEYDNARLACLPGSGGRPTRAVQEFAACLDRNGNRILLSGIGGDEVLGGVPTPIPELGDLLARGRLTLFTRQLQSWAVSKRQPAFHLAGQTIRHFLTDRVNGSSEPRNQTPWLNGEFLRRQRRALGGYNVRWRLFGPRPSFQENLNTLDVLRRQLSCAAISLRPLYEMRYPYLDRNLLEFLYAIPRDQLVRPHMRRSLMRRALCGIVPGEILDRKRKAFLVRGTLVALTEAMPRLVEMAREMVSVYLGIVSPKGLADALAQVQRGQEINVAAVARMLNLEAWLRHLAEHSHYSPSSLAWSPAVRFEAPQRRPREISPFTALRKRNPARSEERAKDERR